MGFNSGFKGLNTLTPVKHSEITSQLVIEMRLELIIQRSETSKSAMHKQSDLLVLSNDWEKKSLTERWWTMHAHIVERESTVIQRVSVLAYTERTAVVNYICYYFVVWKVKHFCHQMEITVHMYTHLFLNQFWVFAIDRKIAVPHVCTLFTSEQ